jgi:hypothetical protein
MADGGQQTAEIMGRDEMAALGLPERQHAKG